MTAVDGYIPVIDLAPARTGDPAARTATADAVARACRTSGFLVATGHGIPAGTVEALYAAVRAFFTGPEDVRAAVTADPLDPLQRGYTPDDRLCMYSANRLGEPESAAERLFVPNPWPAQPGFREAYLAYYAEAERLALDLVRLCALALGLPEDWFDDRFDRHMTPLTANYYPPRRSAPPAGFRNDPHSDFTALTLLYRDEAPGGLQVAHPEHGWVDVPPIPGSLVVNLGQLMAIWTNGRWASTVHRVLNPPAELAHRDRISIAFFYHPNPDAVVAALPTCVEEGTPPRYAPVTAGDYFTGKARRAYVVRRRHAAARDA